MLDTDLAELYGVPTKRLNEQVKRNEERFPEDFAFRLTMKENGTGRKMRPVLPPETFDRLFRRHPGADGTAEDPTPADRVLTRGLSHSGAWLKTIPMERAENRPSITFDDNIAWKNFAGSGKATHTTWRSWITIRGGGR